MLVYVYIIHILIYSYSDINLSPRADPSGVPGHRPPRETPCPAWTGPAYYNMVYYKLT